MKIVRFYQTSFICNTKWHIRKQGLPVFDFPHISEYVFMLCLIFEFCNVAYNREMKSFYGLKFILTFYWQRVIHFWQNKWFYMGENLYKSDVIPPCAARFAYDVSSVYGGCWCKLMAVGFLIKVLWDKIRSFYFLPRNLQRKFSHWPTSNSSCLFPWSQFYTRIQIKMD